jgi:hypothetical protein
MPSNQAIRSQLASHATRLMHRVPESERPDMIRRINRSMSDAGMLDPLLDPKASPEHFGQQMFQENMSLENHLQFMHLPSLLRTEDPEELANHVLPNDGHLECKKTMRRRRRA